MGFDDVHGMLNAFLDSHSEAKYQINHLNVSGFGNVGRNLNFDICISGGYYSTWYHLLFRATILCGHVASIETS